MSSLGYYIHLLDMNHWLNMAQKAVITKNKVRKELWTELGDSIHWDPIGLNEREDYFRLSQQAFVAIQTFLLCDGKSDNLSSDQLLNWATTLADLRSRVPVARYIEMKTQALRLNGQREVGSGDVAMSDPVVHQDV